MIIQNMIYGYLAVCLSMIVFNLVSILVYRKRDRDVTARHPEFTEKVMATLDGLGAGSDSSGAGSDAGQRDEQGAGQRDEQLGGPAEVQWDSVLSATGRVSYAPAALPEEHLEYMRKRLKKLDCLVALDDILAKRTEAEAEKYMAALHGIFCQLAIPMRKKDAVEQAHFAYLCGKYRMLTELDDNLTRFILMVLRDDNIYCRENAMGAIRRSGSEELMMKMLRELDRDQRTLEAKILTDSLVDFQGDRGKLIDQVLAEFGRFSQQMRKIIIDAVRFSGIRRDSVIVGLLRDEAEDDEVRFSCIRYLGRNQIPELLPDLLRFAVDGRDDIGKIRWEYSSIACQVLARYPGEETVRVLKDCVHSRNWYIRSNAAASLASFHLPYQELADILDGPDRFAREILEYNRENENAKLAKNRDAKSPEDGMVKSPEDGMVKSPGDGSAKSPEDQSEKLPKKGGE